MKTLSAILACLLALVVASPACCCAVEKTAAPQAQKEESCCCSKTAPASKKSDGSRHACACAVKQPRQTQDPTAIPPVVTTERDLPPPLWTSLLPPADLLISTESPEPHAHPPGPPPSGERRALLVSRTI